jgi:hypothetical protein
MRLAKVVSFESEAFPIHEQVNDSTLHNFHNLIEFCSSRFKQLWEVGVYQKANQTQLVNRSIWPWWTSS